MLTGKGLGRHLQPPLTPARLDRQWEGVLRLTERHSVIPWKIIGLGVAATAAGAAALLIATREPGVPLAREGTVVETAGPSTQPLTLADGSRLEVAPSSRVELRTAREKVVHLVLSRGAVDLDVTHDTARPFTVSVGEFDVSVRGTRFRVELEQQPPRLVVSVEEGRVETTRRGSGEAGRFVGAGESWSTTLPPRAEPLPEKQATAAADSSAAALPVPARADPSASKVPSEASAARAPEPGFSDLVKERKYKEAYAALGADGFAREVQGADARRLLELADAARFSGHASDAVRALDQLRKTFRSDPRAGLAALELGRLRMDSLGDVAGALQAFDDAVTLASGSVREDAEARRVQALEALGDTARCARARDQYLARFPSGIHAATLRGRCLAR